MEEDTTVPEEEDDSAPKEEMDDYETDGCSRNGEGLLEIQNSTTMQRNKVPVANTK